MGEIDLDTPNPATATEFEHYLEHFNLCCANGGLIDPMDRYRYTPLMRVILSLFSTPIPPAQFLDLSPDSGTTVHTFTQTTSRSRPTIGGLQAVSALRGRMEIGAWWMPSRPTFSSWTGFSHSARTGGSTRNTRGGTTKHALAI